jgi:hypothetical protein
MAEIVETLAVMSLENFCRLIWHFLKVVYLARKWVKNQKIIPCSILLIYQDVILLTFELPMGGMILWANSLCI